MTDLTPLASALHSKIWPLVSARCTEQCETIDEENAYMNRAVPQYAPGLLSTPADILGLIWGVSAIEADLWRVEIAEALHAHGA